MKKGPLFQYFRSAFLIGVGLWFFLIPFIQITTDLWSPSVRSGAIPQSVFRAHKNLSPKFESWARKRILSGRATAGLSELGIAGSEWPLFSAVFFLWTTENLQREWEASGDPEATAPRRIAASAIEAAADLLADPNHATWVKQYWGEEYLDRENLFYRMLLIHGFNSYQSLTDNRRLEEVLRGQAVGLMNELDQSPHGLLDDYPGQCYPIDIVTALAGIQRSFDLLGVERKDSILSSLRGFEGRSVDPKTGMPAYVVDSKTGQAMSASSGVGGVFISLWAAEIWPQKSIEWYAALETHFWDSKWGVVGFREKSRAIEVPLYFEDVDAGPVVLGFGTAASTFGIGAARASGRMDHAWPLMAEATIASWPLPNGTMLMPRILANSDAPLVGEVALLFSASVKLGDQPIGPMGIAVPFVVVLGLSVYLILGGVLVRSGLRIGFGRSSS